VSPSIVAAARHSTPELTAEVYTHLRIEDLRGAVSKLEPTPRRRAKRGA
jgi:hypothetical protein